MVHVSFGHGLSDEQHGQDFQERLHALLERGAFKGLWASDDEKRDLKAWLDKESARLDREFADLAADASQIKAESAQQDADVAALNARTEAANQQASGGPSAGEIEQAKSRRGELQRRISFFNERATTANADGKKFNEEVSRYNSMMAYPDGLGEETLVRRKQLR
jgi:hypothetical protein